MCLHTLLRRNTNPLTGQKKDIQVTDREAWFPNSSPCERGMWKYSFKMINNVKRASNQRHTSDYISTQTGLHTAKWAETGQMESLQRHSPEPRSLIHLAASPMFMLGNILGPFVQLLVHDIHFQFLNITFTSWGA